MQQLFLAHARTRRKNATSAVQGLSGGEQAARAQTLTKRKAIGMKVVAGPAEAKLNWSGQVRDWKRAKGFRTPRKIFQI